MNDGRNNSVGVGGRTTGLSGRGDRTTNMNINMNTNTSANATTNTMSLNIVPTPNGMDSLLTPNALGGGLGSGLSGNRAGPLGSSHGVSNARNAFDLELNPFEASFATSKTRNGANAAAASANPNVNVNVNPNSTTNANTNTNTTANPNIAANGNDAVRRSSLFMHLQNRSGPGSAGGNPTPGMANPNPNGNLGTALAGMNLAGMGLSGVPTVASPPLLTPGGSKRLPPLLLSPSYMDQGAAGSLLTPGGSLLTPGISGLLNAGTAGGATTSAIATPAMAPAPVSVSVPVPTLAKDPASQAIPPATLSSVSATSPTAAASASAANTAPIEPATKRRKRTTTKATTDSPRDAASSLKDVMASKDLATGTAIVTSAAADTDASPDPARDKRREFLERNRVAASRFRRRKKEYIRRIEADLRFYEAEYAEMAAILGTLSGIPPSTPAEPMQPQPALLATLDAALAHGDTATAAQLLAPLKAMLTRSGFVQRRGVNPRAQPRTD
ncbi:hypothetical protein TBLA_0D00190 [Henningerozyma blattae CBS 6284]|uniref:BZIP domain-containing protein n=1 Tax=Henningerozyma blattae (strain ATCC 34711 / CBS 6284 / DSM 70876 / NBRC 10599 / NRRL Y-10934 / UCD 77-7) TaxID=1071380 RepID=I2H2C7_HENB6|nr:hypothetical protein TBLA_0D00190 [Tetrapisispora blattae CBS 6284]CCH60529.1 hypothetical protein TBLA_0D00190 [Tetrapisispora blattae CBS 6284]